MRDIRDLNLVGTTGENRRVETKDGEANQQVVVTYPRPSNGLDDDEKARFASFAAKGLAHLGYGGASDVHSFAQSLFASAEAGESQDEDGGCHPDSITVDGVEYIRA